MTLLTDLAAWFDGVKAEFILNFIDKSRWRMLLTGLGNTLLIAFLACLIGIALFLGITAYDSQKTVRYYVAYQGDSAMLQRTSIYAALQLYLDFINLFLYLLRFFARNRSN